MPDTSPPVDGSAGVEFIRQRSRDTSLVRILSSAALTKGLAGTEICEFGLLQEAGAVAFSNGLQPVRPSQVMRRAMTYARDFDALVIHQCEDPDLGRGGVMNEGELATRLGLSGIPRETETIMLDRDIRIAAMTGVRYHAALVSNTLSLDVIAKARAAGLSVTCGVSINNLTFNETDIGGYRTFMKVSPPLRSESERLALVEALEEGRVTPGSWLLMPAFGGGLTYCSLLVKWGARVTPLGKSEMELPPLTETALQMVNRVRAGQDPHGRSKAGLMAPEFAKPAALPATA